VDEAEEEEEEDAAAGLGHGDGVVMPSSGLSLDQCLLGSSSERSQLQQLRDQLLQY